MITKHTPGPWMTDGPNGYPWTVHKSRQFEDLGPSLGMIARIEDFDGKWLTRFANARLIAAAPDLLQAIKPLIDLAEFWINHRQKEHMSEQEFKVWLALGHESDAMRNARAAIAKAEAA